MTWRAFLRIGASLGWFAVGLLVLLLYGCGLDDEGVYADPWLQLDGENGAKVRAHWRDIPLDVYVVGGSDVSASIVQWNDTAGRRLFNAQVPALPETVALFDDPAKRPYLERAILVRDDGDSPRHGSTDLRYDKRDGRLLNAVVTVHRYPSRIEVHHHEMGHALGLAHGPAGTLMAATLADGWIPLARYQADAVRGLGR